MKKCVRTFAIDCEELFSEFASRIFLDLRKKNRKYNQHIVNQLEITKKNPKIKDILEGANLPKITNLTRKDIYDLRDYFDELNESHYYEFREMFLAGEIEEYYSLKNKGLIK